MESDQSRTTQAPARDRINHNSIFQRGDRSLRKTLPIWGSNMGMGHKSESVKRTGALTISLSLLYNVYLPRYDSGRVISNCVRVLVELGSLGAERVWKL